MAFVAGAAAAEVGPYYDAGPGARAMKDYLASLEKLRTEAAENRLIAGLATNKDKRETFARLAEHLDALADEVEKAMKARLE
jgi:hypothetical protein